MKTYYLLLWHPMSYCVLQRAIIHLKCAIFILIVSVVCLVWSILLIFHIVNGYSIQKVCSFALKKCRKCQQIILNKYKTHHGMVKHKKLKMKIKLWHMVKGNVS